MCGVVVDGKSLPAAQLRSDSKTTVKNKVYIQMKIKRKRKKKNLLDAFPNRK